MNTSTQDPSYLKMVVEHQKLSERALRLHSLLNQHPCVKHLPTEACNLINEMKNIVMTGDAHPEGIELNSNELPFIDPETVHEYSVGDIVRVPSRMAQYKFIVNAKQQFIVEKLIGAEQLQLSCVCGDPNMWKGFNMQITGHYSHFTLAG